MPDTAWKRFERRVARSLGTQRTPLSGSASGHTASDTLHPGLYVECRHRVRHAVQTWMDQVHANATAEGKLPILALQTEGRRDILAVIEWPLLLKLLETSPFHTNQGEP